MQETKKQFSRETAQRALENLKQKIKEANQREDFIYEIKKAVLFGSYINSNKEKIWDIDIALYIDLKDKGLVKNRFEKIKLLYFFHFKM